jgi:tRNA G46 methylase TrmB
MKILDINIIEVVQFQNILKNKNTMIKKFIKNTILYKIYYNTRLKLNILYNIKYTKFKHDKKYIEQDISSIFKNIYEKKEWGDATELGFLQNQNKYFSGTGSYTNASINYVKFIIDYINKNNIKSIVDIGCGDFNIGKQLTNSLPNLNYIGIDIFQEIIDYNNLNYSNDKISFLFINTLIDQVPSADLLLVREVFQHLSNRSIKKIIDLQFPLFNNILITECHPPTNFITTYNLDKPDGPGYRVDHGSGVFLEKEPFNLNIFEIFTTKHEYFGDIKTFKIENQ